MASRKLSAGVWVVIVLGVICLIFLGFTQWRATVNKGGQVEADPFRIAGNFYYIGAADATAFLLTAPEGHVLIDVGYSGSAAMVIASMKKLGFNIRDVKVILNSDPHSDKAGGLAELQDSSGAQVWASQDNAAVLLAGGKSDPSVTSGPMRAFLGAGIGTYPAPRVDRQVKNGETLQVGTISFTAHITAGHAPGCTTWTFPIADSVRTLNGISVCNLEVPPGAALTETDAQSGVRGEFESTFALLKTLPVDVFVTAHAKDFGRYRKFSSLLTGTSTGNPFVDPAGYRAYVDTAEKKFREKISEQSAGKP